MDSKTAAIVTQNIKTMEANDASEEEIQDYVNQEKQKYADRVSAQSAEVPAQEDRGSFGQQVLQGATMNFGDEAMGGIANTYARIYDQLANSKVGDMLGISKGYESGVTGGNLTDDINITTATESIRADLKDYAEKNPGTALAGQILGAIATGGLVGAKLMNLKALAGLGNTAKMATIAGTEGFVAGMGEGEGLEGRLEQGMKQGAQAAVMGPAFQKAGEAVTKYIRAPSAKALIEKLTPTHNPTTLKAAASKLYSEVDDAGLHIKPEAYKPFLDDMMAHFDRYAIDGTTYPKISKAIRRLKSLKDPTYNELDGIKTMLEGAKLSEKMSDRKYAHYIDKAINDFIGDLTPDKVLKGDSRGVARKLEVARDMWHRAEKSDLIEHGVTRAARSKTGRMGGMDEATTGQLSSMVNSTKKSRALGEGTVSSIDDIIHGSRTKNIARGMAEIDPGSATARGGLPISTGFLFGAITNDPKAGVAAAVVTALPLATGTIGKKVANSITAKEVNVLLKAINNEGQLTFKQVIERMVKKYASRTDAAALGLAAAIPGEPSPADIEWEGASPGPSETSLRGMMQP